MSTLTGHDAIEHAERYGLTLRKFTDPTEGARYGLTMEEARAIASEDPSLIWVADVSPETLAELRTESAEAGDEEQVAICNRALAGDHDALVECEEVIAYAAGEAMDDEALD